MTAITVIDRDVSHGDDTVAAHGVVVALGHTPKLGVAGANRQSSSQPARPLQIRSARTAPPGEAGRFAGRHYWGRRRSVYLGSVCPRVACGAQWWRWHAQSMVVTMHTTTAPCAVRSCLRLLASYRFLSLFFVCCLFALGAHGLVQRNGRRPARTTCDFTRRVSFITAQDIVVDGGLIGGTQWSAQQASLKGRNDLLRKLASRL